MKNTKKYHTVLAAASIALAGIIPATFGGEKNQVVQNIAPVVVEQDQVQTRINTAIIDPLNFQAERFSQFSRRMPTESPRYHLAEPENSVEGERTFKVVKTSTPLMKGKNAIVGKGLRHAN